MARSIRYIVLTILIVAFLGVSGFLIAQYSFLNRPLDTVTITIFDVGQGSSALITTPYNHHVLIDGGPDNSIIPKLDARLPFYDRRLDLMILSHLHADHVVGLVDALQKYAVDMVWDTGVQSSSEEYLAFLKGLSDKMIPTKIIDGPTLASLVPADDPDAEPVEIHALFPLESLAGTEVENINNASIVVQMVYGDTEALFMGDLEHEKETELIEYYGDQLESDLLVVGHHGASDSTTDELLDVVQPTYAVISVGEDNPYGHPSPMVVQRILDRGILLYRTDVYGDIEFVSDGRTLTLQDDAEYEE